MSKTITVVLDDATGEFSVDLKGFNGKGCDAIAKAFEDLGDGVVTTEKPEYRTVTTERTVTR